MKKSIKLKKSSKKYNWIQKDLKDIHDMNKNTPDRLKKHLTQYEETGWTDADTWSLDHTLGKWILPRLTLFNKVNFGHPGNFTMKTWQKEIQKMIDAFSIIADESKYWCMNKKQIKTVEIGLDSFREYFYHLWW